MPTVLITGANRGIGLEFTRQYAAAGWRILAGCRSPGSADDLRGLKGDIAIHALDVADTGSVSAAKAAIGSEPIDLLINNAGVIGQRAGKLGNVDYADWNDTLNINLLGPARVAGAFVDNVLASQQKKFATVSTRMSSMTECKAIDFMAYRTRSEEHTSELQSRQYLVCRLLLEKTTNLPKTAAQPALAVTRPQPPDTRAARPCGG